MAPLLEIAAAEKLAVVEDAAHCLTGNEGGRTPGAGTIGAALSFYATKELAVGEGGAIVSDDEGVVARARRWSLHGISRPAHARMQIGARAIVSSSGLFVPRGNFTRDSAIMPFSTRLKSRRCSAVTWPTGTTRVMSVVPYSYWPPESISSRPSPIVPRMQIVACDSSVAR